MPKLSTKVIQISAAASLAVGAFTLPAAANFVGISLCNAAGGSSTPVLHVVDGGDRYTIAPGQGGLTLDILMNERRARAWAAASGLFPEGTVFGNYAGFLCGLQREDTDPEPTEAPEDEEPGGETCDFCDTAAE